MQRPQPPPPSPEPDYVPPEETLFKARLLLSQGKYFDVIQVLEYAVPQMEPRRNQHKGRVLLAKAYAKNPNWVRRAEESLQEVVREDPASVEAHYELGLLYKQVGHAARAQAMFRRVVELRPEHKEASAELGLGESPSGGGLLKRLFGRGKAS
jgi:tetratricopeptide (TPR) repeat protein